MAGIGITGLSSRLDAARASVLEALVKNCATAISQTREHHDPEP